MMPASTRLTGRALRLAHLGWCLVALVYIGVYLATLPEAFRHVSAVTPPFPDWTMADTQAAFAALGLSVDAYNGLQHWLDNGLDLAYIGLGLFLFWRRRDDWMALLLSVTFITFLSTDNFVAVFGAGQLPRWLDNFNGAAISALSLPLFLVFPDGRFVPRWTRWVALFSVAVQVWRMLFPAAYDQVAFSVVLPMFAVVPIAQIYRYFRASGPLQRQQTKWVVAGLVVVIFPLAAYGLLLSLFPELRHPSAAAVAGLLLGTLAWSGFLIVWPLTLSIAILRYRLFDIDVIIRRTLVYAVLSGLLALLYFGSVVAFESLLRGIMGGSSQAAIVLSTLLIAALFGPLRARVQALIDQRFYRRKYDAARTLAAFAASVRDDVDLDALGQRLTAVVDETMQPATISLWAPGAPQRKPHDAAH